MIPYISPHEYVFPMHKSPQKWLWLCISPELNDFSSTIVMQIMSWQIYDPFSTSNTEIC